MHAMVVGIPRTILWRTCTPPNSSRACSRAKVSDEYRMRSLTYTADYNNSRIMDFQVSKKGMMQHS